MVQFADVTFFETPDAVTPGAFRLEGAQASLAIAYLSPYAPFAETIRRLTALAGATPLLAVSTAGELCESASARGSLYRPAGEGRHSLVLQTFSPALIGAVSLHAVPLHNEDIRGAAPPIGRSERVERIRRSLETVTPPFALNSEETVALTFIDGVSASESYFMEAVYQSGRFPCLFIGGSAGGLFDFRATHVHDGATVRQNHAVVAFLKLAPGRRYAVLKSHNFHRTERSFVVLKADPDHRTVSTVADPDTLEVWPAPEAMARLLDCAPEALEQSLNSHTFGIDLDGETYVRSVAGIDHGAGQVSFYCDVNAGDRLYLLEKNDFTTQTRQDYQAFLRGKPPPVAGILNDCILRRLNNPDQLGGLDGLWGCPVAGFSTFGELFGININQTLSGLFFFDVPEGVGFSDPFLERFPVHYGRFVNYFTSCRLNRVDLLNRLRTRTSQSLVDQLAEMDGGAEEVGTLALQARMEQALRASQRRLEAITDSLFDGVLLVDGQGRVMFANPAARRLLGEGAAGEGDLDRLVRLERGGQGLSLCREVAEPALRRHQSMSEEDALFVTADGRRLPVSYAVAPLREERGMEGVVLSFRSIEDLKTAQREAEQASRLASVGQLAAGIAHEINTPIQYVGDNLRFIRQSLEQVSGLFGQIRDLLDGEGLPGLDGPGMRDVLAGYDLDYLLEELPVAAAQSLEGAERIAGIVRSMKEFSHPGTTNKTVTDLNHALETTVTISRNEWKHVARLEMDLAPGLPPVECFAADINQVFLNLIVNAAQALGEAHAQDHRLGTIRIASRACGDHVEIRIADDGPGVPPELRQRIFDPFFTTKGVGKGTGQGLALCLNTVAHKHGGTLCLDAGAGPGATFVVRLPIHAVRQEGAEQAASG